MELQWNLCPFCGNQHVDPYRTESVTIRADDASIRQENTPPGDDGQPAVVITNNHEVEEESARPIYDEEDRYD
jgi:hypothetical protein